MTPHVQVDVEGAGVNAAPTASSPPARPVRWFIIPLSALLCAAAAVATVYLDNVRDLALTTTLISVLAFAALFVAALVVNPLLRLAFRGRVRPLSSMELLCIFTALLVTSGVSTLGLTQQLVPLIASPWNPEWNVPQRQWGEDLLPHLNRKLYLDIPAYGSDAEREAARAHIAAFRQGLTPVDDAGLRVEMPRDDAPFAERARYALLVWRQLPWRAWAGPLTYWCAFIAACYGLFYCLTYVVLGDWSRREQLIFPLAKIAESMLPEDADGARLPSVMRSKGFWLVFGCTFALLSWNAAADQAWLGGLSPVPLGMTRRISVLTRGTVFEGWSGVGAPHFMVIFTAVGIAFLLPKAVSFSIWFYYWAGMAVLLVLVWLGYGQNTNDFPTDYLRLNNPVTAQGAGAMLAFSLIILARSVRGAKQPGWVAGLLVSAAIVIAWLAWNAVPIGWAAAMTVIVALYSLGYMRLVAEAGVYWFQWNAGVFHLYNALGAGKALAACAMAPVLPIFYTLFIDVKTFLAPNLANAAKMQQDAGRDRRAFHLNIVVCLVATVAVSLLFAVFLAHLRGGQEMRPWFYNGGPPNLLDAAVRMVQEPPAFDGAIVAWYAIGAAWLIVTVVLRRTRFWFPHPIGYIMLVNPLTGRFALSFFVGWLCKKLCIAYGGKQTYDLLRPCFLGLIAGELMAIAAWSALGIALHFNPTLSLNRF